jgi:hypothetical protein
MSKDYFKVIDAIIDCYKKMLQIGKCNKLFRSDHGGLPDILTPKSSKVKGSWGRRLLAVAGEVT